MARTASRFAPETDRQAHSTRCPVCGSYKTSKAFDCMALAFDVWECTHCGLGRTVPPVPIERIGKYYPDVYYGRDNVRFNVLFEHLTRLFRQRRSRVIRARTKPGPVLDVGCGRGFILSSLKSLGYEPHGIELSETAAWHARHVLGLDIETCDFLLSPHRKGAYNAVIMWHSLEHMPRPVEAIGRAHELLKKGGVLAVAVPNYESLQARIFGRYWFHLDVPRHYFHFGTGSLASVLARHRFRIIKEDHFSFEQNPYGWIQSIYNALGFDENFLYSLLKNRSARTVRLRKHPFQVLLTLLTLPFVTLIGLVMTLVEAGLRMGGTIEVYAVRQDG